jgi:branched-chain amino acid transport system ATP-binding protein
VIETRSLCVAYGPANALWDASMRVAAGELVAVVGPNGAGKTTLINTLAGLLRVKSGELLVDGRSVLGVPSHRFCELGIAIVPEGRRLFTGMTVRENLDLGAYRRGARSERERTLEEVFALFPVLKERQRQRAGTLSGGQQQALAIGRALMARPRLLLLDEPSLGLSPAIVMELFAMVKDINRRGVAVLLVEQNVSMALDLASRAYVLQEGRTIAEGAPSDLMARPELRQAYLGL